MNRLNRRRFMALSSAGVASTVLVACNSTPTTEELQPTQIPGVEGAPPTLAPITSTPQAGGGGGGEDGGNGGGEQGGGAAGTVTIEAGDLYYDPTELELAPGDTVVMNNAGMLEHNLVIEDWEDEEVIPLLAGGESGEWVVPDDVEVGSSVVFYCSVPGHREAGMEGTFTFVETSAAGGGEEGTPEDEAAAAGATDEQGGGAQTVEMEAGDLYYDPTEIELAPGATLVLNNAGMLEHNLVIEDWDDEEVIPMLAGGESGEWVVPDDVEVGSTVTFYCSVPGHREAGMEGTITFVEADTGGDVAAAVADQDASTEEAVAGEEDTEAAAASGGGEPQTVEIEAGDLYYDPTELELAPGDTLVMNNAGMLEHNLVVEDWDDEEVIPMLAGGESGEWTVPDDVEVGSSVVFYCSVPGHREAGMEGTMTFVEAGGGEAAAASDEASTEEATPEDAAAGAASESGDSGDANAVALEAFEMGYEPAEFTVSPGGVITLTNTGVLEHDFAVDDWGGSVIDTVAAGGTGEYTVPDDVQPGETFEFYCSIPGHKESGMVGTITIV